VTGGDGTFDKGDGGTDTLVNVDQVQDGLGLYGGDGDDLFDFSAAGALGFLTGGRGNHTGAGGTEFDIWSLTRDAP
jgi:hypothetical protein